MIVQSNEISLKDAIEKMLHTYKLKGKVYEAQIVQAWARIVGSQIEKAEARSKEEMNKELKDSIPNIPGLDMNNLPFGI